MRVRVNVNAIETKLYDFANFIDSLLVVGHRDWAYKSAPFTVKSLANPYIKLGVVLCQHPARHQPL